MKAIRIDAFGGLDVMKLKDDVPKPVRGENHVLVEVCAAGLNPFDDKFRSGMFDMDVTFPFTLGGDVSGIVVDAQKDGEYAPGDRIYGSAIVLNGGSGAYAEFATLTLANLAKMPEKLNFEEAAALPLVGSSAVQALDEHIKLADGQKILVHGGAGGIGHIAIQLAKGRGAYVATTVGSYDVEFAKKLGADIVIDYKAKQFEDELSDYDAVFDTVGGSITQKSFQVLKKGGVIVSMLGQPDESLAKDYGVSAIGQGTNNNAGHLKKVSQYVEEGVIKPYVDSVFPMEQVADAFVKLTEGHPESKVVLKIKESA